MRGGMPGKRECKPQCALCRPSDLAPPLHFLAHHSSTADCWLPENCLQCNAGWCQTPPSPTRPSAPATRAAAGRRCMRPAGRGTSSVRQRCRVSAPAVLQQQQYSLIQRFHSIIFSAHPRLPPCPPPAVPGDLREHGAQAPAARRHHLLRHHFVAGQGQAVARRPAAL